MSLCHALKATFHEPAHHRSNTDSPRVIDFRPDLKQSGIDRSLTTWKRGLLQKPQITTMRP
ncbi:hypothetical protein M404DRAFT_1000512 [Pisolithus tinctorius Marx 270]|uniref:Uncharacterized protein n=1 Tax=Pisolithus tinctorius Marx 270 TaxID=870435 RepID=A0A0C3PA02_PISTI|nr:hypothetical protein M404DRAFT_1000512 [Pisolithus tinctorius Marx 270]